MSKKSLFLALQMASILLLSGCEVHYSSAKGGGLVQGSGVKATETRTLAPFKKISILGAPDVSVKISDAQKVTVETDDNLIKAITTEVNGDNLVISCKRSYSSKLGVKATIEVPALNAVSIRGSGDIAVQGLDEDSFAIDIFGSGDVTVDGRAQSLDVKIAGSGDADASKLKVRTASVNVTGSGDVSVDATDTLKASIRGSGEIRYKSGPSVIRNITGSGSVRKY